MTIKSRGISIKRTICGGSKECKPEHLFFEKEEQQWCGCV
jgi:hypothetical protein